MSIPAVTGNDHASEVVMEALRAEGISAHEKQQALIRIGLIAQAYIGASPELVEAVFGSRA